MGVGVDQAEDALGGVGGGEKGGDGVAVGVAPGEGLLLGDCCPVFPEAHVTSH